MPSDAAGAGYRQALTTLLGVLSLRRKRQLALLTLLTLVNGAADLLMVSAAMVFLAALAGTALPAPLADWAGALTAGGQIGPAAMAFAGSALIANLVRLSYLRLSETYVARVGHELTMEVHWRVFAQPYDYHVRHHSSELLASLETVRALASNLIHQWLQSAAALATGAAVAWLLIRIDPLPATAAFAALGGFYLAVARLAARRLNANSEIVGEAYGARIRKAQESLGAIRDLKIDHSEAARLDDFRLTDARYAGASASTAFVVAAPRYVVEAGAVLLIAALTALLAGREGGNALVLIGGIALGGLRALPLMQQAYRSWAMMAANRSITGQVVGLLGLPTPPEGEDEVAPLPFRSSIRLDKVGFAYPERPEPALRDVTLEIERDGRIALLGETGSGKSTLADILMGLLEPQSGTVVVDGAPLTADKVRAWQRNIAHVSQSSFLVDDSIARNIAFSRPGGRPDLDRVRAAAEAAGIAEFIDSLPHGYDTMVGERGMRLSGGQRQRIAIARALYKEAPVLVLDEATNALDPETEAKVLASLFADRERTIILIAHRPAALGDCRLIRLKDGRIAEG